MKMSFRVSAANLALVTSAAAPIAALSLALTAIIPQEMTRNHGVTLQQAGLVFVLIRLADIVIDPFLGGLMDRTRSRLGRYQIWILGGSLPLAAGVWFCFFPPAQVSVTYLVFALGASYLGFSMLALAHLALCAAQSDDYAGRGRVFSYWQFYTTLGLLLAILLPKLLEGGLGLSLVQWMGVTILGMIAGTVVMTVFIGKARPPKAVGGRGGIKAYLSLFRLAATRRIMAAELLIGLAAGISAVSGAMFLTSVKHFTLSDFGSQVSALFFVSIVSSPIWARITRRLQKQHALMLGAACYIVGQALFAFVPPGNLWFLLLGPPLFSGFAYAGITMMPRAMIADAADEERLARGNDCTALLYALLTGIFKLGHALSVGIGLFALDAFGYVPSLGADNGPAALWGVVFVYTGLPILCALSAFIMMIGYPLTSERHSAIRKALEERDGVATA
jgi:Na+/melibiose symporter-like transporter